MAFDLTGNKHTHTLTCGAAGGGADSSHSLEFPLGVTPPKYMPAGARGVRGNGEGLEVSPGPVERPEGGVEMTQVRRGGREEGWKQYR